MSQQLAAADTTTPPPTKAKPTPLYVGEQNEAVLKGLRDALKHPGTELGLLVRGLETDLRSVQARLNARGSGLIPAPLGVGASTRVEVSIPLAIHVEVGSEVRVFAFHLVPNPPTSNPATGHAHALDATSCDAECGESGPHGTGA